MAWFFMFNENTTLKEIRIFFENEENCKRFIMDYRTKAYAGIFDTIAAFILGGAINSTPCTLNYCKAAFNKENNDPSTWGQNLLTWTVGKGESIIPVNELCSAFDDTIKLNNLYSKLNEWTGWIKEDKKNKVLSLLRWSNLYVNQTGKAESDNMNQDVYSIICNIIKANKQVIFTGSPGTGKTWSVRKYVKKACVIPNGNEKIQDDKDDKLMIDENQYKFVQFHPSYDYSDFVEGLRPVVLKGQSEPTFVRMDGVFKAFCRHIVEENNDKKTYYFIVDEINRADLAKVFGELMFGLEESYRGKDNPIDTQYKNLDTYRIIQKEEVDNPNIKDEDIGKAIPIEDDVFKDGFYIPENLHFIGTMNDIDRSVDSMDFALRRRFQWVDIKANEIMKASLHSILDNENTDVNSDNYKKIDFYSEKIKKMNEVISGNNKFGLSEAYHIGPAYFKKLDINNDKSMESVFETNIVSILKEYTRGRKSQDVDKWIDDCRKALLGED